MVIYSKEKRSILDLWRTFLGYSNKVTRNLKGFSDVEQCSLAKLGGMVKVDFLRNQIWKRYIAVGAHVKVVDGRYGADRHDTQGNFR